MGGEGEVGVVIRLFPSLAGRTYSWCKHSLIPRLISSFYEKEPGYEASTHMHIHIHTHLLEVDKFLDDLLMIS